MSQSVTECHQRGVQGELLLIELKKTNGPEFRLQRTITALIMKLNSLILIPGIRGVM